MIVGTKIRVRYKDTDCMKVVDTLRARCIIHDV